LVLRRGRNEAGLPLDVLPGEIRAFLVAIRSEQIHLRELGAGCHPKPTDRARSAARAGHLTCRWGSRIDFETTSVAVKFDAAKIAIMLERYGGNPFEAIGRDYDSDAALAAG
jgi:hypothetical protein